MTSPPESDAAVGRAQIIGTGLIGGSVGLALRQEGWHVAGVDASASNERDALERGAVDEIGIDPQALLVIVCTPSHTVSSLVEEALARTDDPELVVTDVAGVKASIVGSIKDPRFIGGHPMAGSEQFGVAGSRSDLFLGATWVLTPGPSTSPEAYGRLLAVVRSLGANGVALSAEDHDRLVALVSHVPHLVASALMNEASAAAESDAALLQLAAGGFRDMTRVAAGDPGIWPEVCVENAEAILEGLDELMSRLTVMRSAIASGDRPALHGLLQSASAARRSLPGRATNPELLASIRIPVPDRAGVLADVASAASEIGVSVVDIEIAHSVEGGRGVMIVVVARVDAHRYGEALSARGFSCTVADL